MAAGSQKRPATRREVGAGNALETPSRPSLRSLCCSSSALLRAGKFVLRLPNRCSGFSVYAPPCQRAPPLLWEGRASFVGGTGAASPCASCSHFSQSKTMGVSPRAAPRKYTPPGTATSFERERSPSSSGSGGGVCPPGGGACATGSLSPAPSSAVAPIGCAGGGSAWAARGSGAHVSWHPPSWRRRRPL